MLPAGLGLVVGGVANAVQFSAACSGNGHNTNGAGVAGGLVAGVGLVFTIAGGIRLANSSVELRRSHRVSGGQKTGMVFLALGTALTSYAALSVAQLVWLDGCFST